jgi:hypothetical protein
MPMIFAKNMSGKFFARQLHRPASAFPQPRFTWDVEATLKLCEKSPAKAGRALLSINSDKEPLDI